MRDTDIGRMLVPSMIDLGREPPARRLAFLERIFNCIVRLTAGERRKVASGTSSRTNWTEPSHIAKCVPPGCRLPKLILLFSQPATRLLARIANRINSIGVVKWVHQVLGGVVVSVGMGERGGTDCPDALWTA